jgi:hypothetical protein
MDALDTLALIVESPLFMAVAVLTVVGGTAYAVLQAVRTRQRIVSFMQAHGFRWTDTGSTMWLARLIERWEMLEISGALDGLSVDVRMRIRRGRCITVTANRDLVSRPDAGVVSVGAWTHPRPPALLEGMHLDVSGRQLRLFVGGGDFVPYLRAAVAYARTLEGQPVDPAVGAAPPIRP